MLAFLLGTLTYTIFDPIRSLMVEGKMLNWFDFRRKQRPEFVWCWVAAATYSVDRIYNLQMASSKYAGTI